MYYDATIVRYIDGRLPVAPPLVIIGLFHGTTFAIDCSYIIHEMWDFPFLIWDFPFLYAVFHLFYFFIRTKLEVDMFS